MMMMMVVVAITITVIIIIIIIIVVVVVVVAITAIVGMIPYYKKTCWWLNSLNIETPVKSSYSDL
jgi:hypothetical protein